MPEIVSTPAASRFVFSSQNGHALLRAILKSSLPYVPHDYQLEGVCQLLDGKDLIAVLATGSGKTGYYLMYALMLRELSARPGHYDARIAAVPQDPCIVMVYPTNGLEEEQAVVFESAGLKTVVINTDTLERAAKAGADLWAAARQGATMILLSPEQLTSPRFETLLQRSEFQARVCAIGIDEVHLLYSWGRNFRKSYRQLGHARARFPSRTRLIGTTASLLAGDPQESVFSFLGLRSSQLYFLRRSNLRPAIETRFRIFTHGIGSWSFPDLKWILSSNRKTVIHCRTIAIGFRVAVYLWRLMPPTSDRAKRIRMYNALNRASYNTETRRLVQENPETRIIIATASFMVGLDLPNIADVVVVGNLINADEHVQWQGRAGRDPSVVRDARFITYITKKAMQTARALCDGKPPRGTEKTRSGKKSATVQMELSMARLLLAPCLTATQNTLYDNPPTDSLCACPRCSPPTRQPILPPDRSSTSLPSILAPEPTLPTTAPAGTQPVAIPSCRCSGCIPEPTRSMTTRTRPVSLEELNPIARKDRLTREMRQEGSKKLRELRIQIYLQTSTPAARAMPAEVFLPESVIKKLLDRFALLNSQAAVEDSIAGRTYLLPHSKTLWETLQDLRPVFEQIRTTAKERAKVKKAAGQAGMVGSGGDSALPDAVGEFFPGPWRSFEECCGSFKLGEPSVTSQAQPGSAALQDLVAMHHINWDLKADVEGSKGRSSASVGPLQIAPLDGGRKRSGTASVVNPRPQTRARTANKENHV